MATMLERLLVAWNSHDADRVAALFSESCVSDQPVHPGRGFIGRPQVLANWTAVFEGVPDFSAELVGSSIDGETEWAEWNWVWSPSGQLVLRHAGGHDPGGAG